MTEQPHDPTGPAPEPAFAAPDPGQQQYAQPFPQQYGQPMYYAPTTPPPPSRGRRAWIPVVGVVALVAAFGAGLAVGRTTAPKATTASSALPGSITVTSTASSSSTTSTAPTTAATISPGNLVSALLPVPTGGRLRTATGAGPNGSLTLAQYVSMLYSGSASETTNLQARGFTAGATRWMDTASGQEVSIYLTAFQGDNGAQSYALAAVQAHAAGSTGQTQFTVPELTDGQGFETGTLDKYGNTDSNVYGAVGDVMIIVHCYTPAKLDRAALLALVDQQAARLATYEKAS